VKANVDRVEVEHASFTTRLGRESAGSFDGYVLLDAQDWMSKQQMTELWEEINRTARPGARVIFRTAGDASPLDSALPSEILTRWSYDADACRAYVAQDRSSIYGGFHLYQLNG
jgi:S-adenosylmethionine-diacylglycerol 3-amino-3-carboxypropyl transferase